MRREELLRRLEERLARGEIAEKTYLEIKTRYEAVPETPEPPQAPEPQPPPVAGNLEGLIRQTIDRVMGQVGETLEATLGSEEFDRRMEDIGHRVERAFANFGPQVETEDRRVVIRGSGAVTVGAPLDEFRCSGSGKVSGDLRATEVHIAGACRIEGSCECDEFESSGSARVGQGLQAHEVSTSGTLEVGGDLAEAEEVTASGSLEVSGWVRTKEFTSRGRFDIRGGLEAEEVDISLAGASRVPIVRAQEITVKRGRRNGDLEVDTIEGGEVYLEATRARLIRGNEVRLGPFCTADRVEAQELEVHETSSVGHQALGGAEAEGN